MNVEDMSVREFTNHAARLLLDFGDSGDDDHLRTLFYDVDRRLNPVPYIVDEFHRELYPERYEVES